MEETPPLDVMDPAMMDAMDPTMVPPTPPADLPAPENGTSGLPPRTTGGAPGTKLYVGNLRDGTAKAALEDLFSKHGTLTAIEMKHGGFAFVEYTDPRDAEEAINKLNRTVVEGNEIRVEFSKRPLARGPAGETACYICNKGGHWARDCPENANPGMDVRSGKCFKCGNPGHLAKQCRDDPRGGPPARDYGGRDHGRGDYGRGGGGGDYGRGYDRDYRAPSPYRGGREDPYYRERSPPPRDYRRPPSPAARGYGGGGYGRERSPPPAPRGYSSGYARDDYPSRDPYRRASPPPRTRSPPPPMRSRSPAPPRRSPPPPGAPRSPAGGYPPRRSPPSPRRRSPGPPPAAYSRDDVPARY